MSDNYVKGWDEFAEPGGIPKFCNEFGFKPGEFFLGTRLGQDIWVYSGTIFKLELGCVYSNEPGDYSSGPMWPEFQEIIRNGRVDPTDARQLGAQLAVKLGVPEWRGLTRSETIEERLKSRTR